MWKLVFLSLFFFGQATLLDKFENWVREFGIKFSDKHQFHNVFHTWTQNHKFIEEINARNLSYKLGHNPFSGMNSEQFRVFMGFSTLDAPSYEYFSKFYHDEKYEEPALVENLPTSVDWTAKGGVTPVKDQGQCGSCWSFSTTGALEGAYFAKYSTLPSFSEQQLVDCDTRRNGGKDMGCNGGLMDNAFSWIEKNGGLCSESDYPYVSGTTKTGGSCQTSCNLVKNSVIRDFIDVTPSSENAMMSAVAKQSVSVAIEADQREFQLYKSGIFTGACGTKLDHGVLLVGYGFFDGLDYWKVKNSWSQSWGDGGYILLGKGPQYNNGDGQCGILLQGSYPVL
jgi:C1A family cysteine protease